MFDPDTVSNGTPGSFGDAISDDGRVVLFSWNAINLVPGDTNLDHDVFVRVTPAP